MALDDLKKLLDQRAELDARIEAAQREARDAAIAQVRELMAAHGLSAADLVARVPRQGGKVAVKYRDKAGNTWSGRGLKPKWLAAALAGGAKIEDFAL